jgi:hypothetical protein
MWSAWLIPTAVFSGFYTAIPEISSICSVSRQSYDQRLGDRYATAMYLESSTRLASRAHLLDVCVCSKDSCVIFNLLDFEVITKDKAMRFELWLYTEHF